MYWFSWGEQTDFEWGCTRNSTCCTCDAATGALTYKLEDLWQERMTQGLSALFTYSVLLATPWSAGPRLPRPPPAPACLGTPSRPTTGG